MIVNGSSFLNLNPSIEILGKDGQTFVKFITIAQILKTLRVLKLMAILILE